MRQERDRTFARSTVDYNISQNTVVILANRFSAVLVSRRFSFMYTRTSDICIFKPYGVSGMRDIRTGTFKCGCFKGKSVINLRQN